MGHLSLAKGFCRVKFWAKFAFWKGAVPGEVFGEVWAEVCGKVSSLFCWDIQTKKEIQIKFQPRKPTALHSKTGKYSGKDFITRLCRGTLAESFLASTLPDANSEIMLGLMAQSQSKLASIHTYHLLQVKFVLHVMGT